MKAKVLAPAILCLVLCDPGAAAAAPFTAVFDWQAFTDPQPASLFGLEFLGGIVPADIVAEVTLTGPYQFAVGFDPYCGQVPVVAGSSFAFCSNLLAGFGQDAVPLVGIPDTALLTLLFGGNAGPVSLTARLGAPGTALLEYDDSGRPPIPEPSTLVLVCSGLFGAAGWGRRRSRR
jgi:hypothetical protein